MHKCGMIKILAEMEENNLVKSFTEIAKLLNILIAIPMCSTEAERTFLALKRIKTYLRNTMGQSRLNSLKVFTISRDLVNDCDSFNSKVMEMFNKNEKCISSIKVKNNFLTIINRENINKFILLRAFDQYFLLISIKVHL